MTQEPNPLLSRKPLPPILACSMLTAFMCLPFIALAMIAITATTTTVIDEWLLGCGFAIAAILLGTLSIAAAVEGNND